SFCKRYAEQCDDDKRQRIKLVMSCRDTVLTRTITLLLESGGVEVDLFPPEVFHMLRVPGRYTAGETYRIAVQRMSPDEVERMYEAYRALGDDSASPGGDALQYRPLTPFIGLSPEAVLALSEPAMLRM